MIAIRTAFCLLALPFFSCFSAEAQVPSAGAPASVSPVSLASISKSMPALVAAVSSGSDRACVPTHLTLSGKAINGDRLFVSALVPQFASELRKSAKGSAKLTREQTSELARMVKYAERAQSSAEGFPLEFIERFTARTGLALRADILCLSRESLSSN